jgi:hypothetical protein
MLNLPDCWNKGRDVTGGRRIGATTFWTPPLIRRTNERGHHHSRIFDVQDGFGGVILNDGDLRHALDRARGGNGPPSARA